MSIYGRNIDLYRDYLMINEAYIGKTPTLLKIEEKIGEARKKIKYYGANNTLKEVLEINRLFEKQFGMDIYALQIYPANSPNAYTHVLAINFDIAKYETLHSMIVGDINNGYRFKPNNNFCIIVNIASSIMMDNNITDEEIVALLLHELGHNFADCIYEDIEIYNKKAMKNYRKFLSKQILLSALLVIPTLGLAIPSLIKNLNNKYGSEYSNYRKNKEQKHSQKEGHGVFSSFIRGLKAKCDDTSSFVSELLIRISGGGELKRNMRGAELNGLPETVRKSLGRQNEVIADKFAAIYGYGPALSSSLMKMDEYRSGAYKFANKINKKANSKYEEVIMKINDYDVHPYAIQRANEELKLLRNELDREDLDPKVRQTIEMQISEILNIINKYTNTSEELDKDDNAKRLYNAYINNECPDAVDQEIEDRIEKALNDALRGKKNGGKKKDE